ncbi:hypothetical protein BEWA_020820 [Theileria equi strain WA]|uniref:Uncharacterized protein n=1 Tax=Theileria equi strain WA TaxID=1537102 RepID=L0AUK3_THEEQ|nr:hypothetical protein BEWA_020820 [Theileria equi strain WA]AFZ79235.1 hypothetical protein BEWA_020820 [Theileria equi strain WA]|eukprot:XP_004828901.1 hypothetical protein BEWA_020820 [Theileria equi strain WA]
MAPSIPLLIIHGVIDEIVPVSHGQKLYDSYKSDFKMADFQPKSMHNYYSVENDIVAPIKKFLEQFGIGAKNVAVNVAIPDWFYYNCRGLVKNQVKKIKGSFTSRSNLTSKTQEWENEQGDVSRTLSVNTIDSCISEVPQKDTTEQNLGKSINRNIQTATFTSSLHELCQKNSIHPEDINDMVNDAIVRNQG